VIGDYYPLDEQPQMRPEELTVAEEEAMEAGKWNTASSSTSEVLGDALSVLGLFRPFGLEDENEKKLMFFFWYYFKPYRLREEKRKKMAMLFPPLFFSRL